MTRTITVPEDPAKPGFDVLIGEIGTRTHFIHCIMAANGPLSVSEIGLQARALAATAGHQFNQETFSPAVTRSHLVSMRDKPGRGFAEQLPDKRWQLTQRARQKIADATGSPPATDIRTVDSKCRVLLPREFANATVTIESTSPGEIRIRKAVVLPEADLPLIEQSLPPLSDRDRDFFLALLDNPPPPTPALRAAMAKYKRGHA
jgi:hypothetical protein